MAGKRLGLCWLLELMVLTIVLGWAAPLDIDTHNVTSNSTLTWRGIVSQWDCDDTHCDG